uniref:Uncharacterized protein n=1 Tax=Arundo donax TaxID=35708 RepID=A0A0A9HCH2_ARUDO
MKWEHQGFHFLLSFISINDIDRGTGRSERTKVFLFTQLHIFSTFH